MVLQAKSATAKVWPRVSNSGESNQAGLLTLTLSPVVDRNNHDVTHHYLPNDAIFADLDGDGQLEFIINASTFGMPTTSIPQPTKQNTPYGRHTT